MAQTTGSEQAKLWNGHAGRAWVEAQALLDRTFHPFEQHLVETVTAAAAGRVLDIGCGTGTITLALARRAGATGNCTGIDISEAVIGAARARAAGENTPAQFICADAQTHPFEPSHFDWIVSRFGVMFFEDPWQAFANLRRAAKQDAALLFFAWRSAAENPFMTTAERAAGPLLGNRRQAEAARLPDAPGQFGFADPGRVFRILEESGWTGIDIRPMDVTCRFPEAELNRYFTTLGPLGIALAEVDGEVRAEITQRVRAAFEPYVDGAEVRFTAACWRVEARAAAL